MINNPSADDNLFMSPPQHLTLYDIHDIRKRQDDLEFKLTFIVDKLNNMLDEIAHIKAKISELERRD